VATCATQTLFSTQSDHPKVRVVSAGHLPRIPGFHGVNSCALRDVAHESSAETRRRMMRRPTEAHWSPLMFSDMGASDATHCSGVRTTLMGHGLSSAVRT
jgi:hypothetical protein